MEHVEFIDNDHFEHKYHRQWAKGDLLAYIDFCWETDFDDLLQDQPEGFSDILFPNIGYTYIINLGTPFVMQLEKNALEVKNDGFVPRHHYITARHSKGNKLFGIKFKVCPIVFEKEVDFSEYTDFVYPLAYLIDRTVVAKVKNAASFTARAEVVFKHYQNLLHKYSGQLGYVSIVTNILKNSLDKKEFNQTVDELPEKFGVSEKTLEKYFRTCTSFSSKQALQTMRIRDAVTSLTRSPDTFQLSNYGYYDQSIFLEHLEEFTGKKYFEEFLGYLR